MPFNELNSVAHYIILWIIDLQFAIRELRIKGFFVCPWIDLNELNNTGMEKLLSELLSRSD